MTLEYKVTEFDQNMTVKSILKNKLNISNRLLTKLKINKKIYVDSKVAFVNTIPPIDSTIYVYIDFNDCNDFIEPEEGDIEVLYEDDYFLAINKPANMVVHPCSYHPNQTLSNYVKYYLKSNQITRPINRLDKDTTGVVLFAKNEYIQELFKNMDTKPIKQYIAVVYGRFEKKEGTISLPIARKADSIIEREVNLEAGQEAITHYKVEKEEYLEGRPISILKVFLETGRTHQIRVHFSHIGHPLIGDSLYGNELSNDVHEINRQALHAHKLIFTHPILNKSIEIEAKLPEDIKKLGKCD